MEDSEIFEPSTAALWMLFDWPYLMFRGFKFLCRVVNTTPAANSYVGPTVVTCFTCSCCLRSFTNL